MILLGIVPLNGISPSRFMIVGPKLISMVVLEGLRVVRELLNLLLLVIIGSGTSVTLTRKIMQVCCIAYIRKERRDM